MTAVASGTNSGTTSGAVPDAGRRGAVAPAGVVRWIVAIAVVVIIGLAVVEALSFTVLGNTYSLGLARLNLALAFMAAVLGLQVIVGYTGQLAIGQSFFFGCGAYLTAWLVADQGWPVLLCLVVILPFCAVVGLVTGLPALRVRGLYLALVTLGLAVSFPLLVQLDVLDPYTNGAGGKTMPSVFAAPSWVPIESVYSALHSLPILGGLFGSGELSGQQVDRLWRYLVYLVIIGVLAFCVRRVVSSREGRAMRALRENEMAASVAGVNPARTKSTAFALAAMLGGVGGLMYVSELGIASPTDFSLVLAINLLIALIIGGIGTVTGAIIGGLVIAFLPDWMSSTEELPGVPERLLEGPTASLFLGVALIAITFFLPRGLVTLPDRIRELRTTRSAPVTNNQLHEGEST